MRNELAAFAAASRTRAPEPVISALMGTVLPVPVNRSEPDATANEPVKGIDSAESVSVVAFRFVTVPVLPENKPAKEMSSDRSNTSAAFAVTLPTIWPAVPPAPIWSVPPEITVPSV